MMMKSAAATSIGRVRGSNEDAFGLCAARGLYVVCDGMGGAAGGEIASHMAVDTFLARMSGEDQDLRQSLQTAIAAANTAVYQRAESDPSLQGMGTTLVALLLADERALVGHAGDSRCYLLRDGELRRCTQDHSLVEEQIRLGAMTREEAEYSPLRNVITRAIGTQPTVREDILDLTTEPGDLFLLCTDGLTRELNDRAMARVLERETDLDTMAQRLVESANAAGGRDNITCLLVRIAEGNGANE